MKEDNVSSWTELQDLRVKMVLRAKESKDSRFWGDVINANIPEINHLINSLGVNILMQFKRDMVLGYKWWDSLSMLMGVNFSMNEIEIEAMKKVATAYLEGKI